MLGLQLSSKSSMFLTFISKVKLSLFHCSCSKALELLYLVCVCKSTKDINPSNLSQKVGWCPWSSFSRGISPSNFTQIVDVLILHFPGKVFGISLLWYNFKTVVDQWIYQQKDIRAVDKGTLYSKVPARSLMFLTVTLMSNYRNFIVF